MLTESYLEFYFLSLTDIRAVDTSGCKWKRREHPPPFSGVKVAFLRKIEKEKIFSLSIWAVYTYMCV